MNKKKMSIRKNTDFQDIAETITQMRDLYASIYKERKYATQYILQMIQSKFPQYSTRSIYEFIIPLKPIKDEVRNGTYTKSTIKDQELIEKLETIIHNLKNYKKEVEE